MRTNWSWKRCNDFSNTLRNNSKIPYGSHWLQWFLELRLLLKPAMLVTSCKREVKASIVVNVVKRANLFWTHSQCEQWAVSRELCYLKVTHGAHTNQVHSVWKLAAPVSYAQETFHQIHATVCWLIFVQNFKKAIILQSS